MVVASEQWAVTLDKFRALKCGGRGTRRIINHHTRRKYNSMITAGRLPAGFPQWARPVSKRIRAEMLVKALR